MAIPALAETTDDGNEAMSFVYVIGPSGGPLKIGVANDVHLRRAGIQVSQARPITVLFSLEVPANRRYDIEKHAHAILASKRTMGEWFAVSPSAAIKAVQEAANDVASGRPAPAPSMHERNGGRGLRSEDGLKLLLRRSPLGPRQRMAALVYRRLFDRAQSDAGKLMTGETSIEVPNRTALKLLDRVHATVSARVGPRAAAMLLEVVGQGIPMTRLPGSTVQRHIKRAELRESLYVVADLLTEADR